MSQKKKPNSAERPPKYGTKSDYPPGGVGEPQSPEAVERRMKEAESSTEGAPAILTPEIDTEW